MSCVNGKQLAPCKVEGCRRNVPALDEPARWGFGFRRVLRLVFVSSAVARIQLEALCSLLPGPELLPPVPRVARRPWPPLLERGDLGPLLGND